MMPFLSIIIPCYNVERYLPRTLKSLSQLNNAEECEFIFINDGSSDSTLSILQDFALNHTQSKIIDQHNQGVSAARNAALEIAIGKYLLCLDGDDFIDANTVNILKDNIHHTDALLSPCIIVNEDDSSFCQKITIPGGIYSIDQLYQSCDIFPTAPQIVYRTSIIQEHHLRFDSKIKAGEVYTFSVDFFEYAKEIAVCNNSFYNYVMRPSSATHKPNYNADLSVLHILEHFERITQQWKNRPSFQITALKIILSFTYNKYIKNKLSDAQTTQTVKTILKNPKFQQLLSSIQVGNLDLKNRLFLYYLKTLPLTFGFRLCVFIAKIVK